MMMTSRPRESCVQSCNVTDIMDSQVQVEGRLLDLVTDEWRKERLPLDDINVPVSELPDPEAEDCQTASLLHKHFVLEYIELKYLNN